MHNDNMNISEHMEVVGSDGLHVGTVDKVMGDRIKLTRNDPDAGGKHHTISMDQVGGVEQNQVRLNQPAEQAKAAWQSA